MSAHVPSSVQVGASSTIEEVVFSVFLCTARTLLPGTSGEGRTAIIVVSSGALRARLCLEVLCELAGILLVGIELALGLGRSWRTRWGGFFRLEVWVGHGCQQSVAVGEIVILDLPNRALNAGSTLPPLATKTALMTLESIVGKASLRVFSFWDCGLKGRAGLVGASSSSTSTKLTCLGVGLLSGLLSWWSSSSKSSSRAVVGDSPPVFLPPVVLVYTDKV